MQSSSSPFGRYTPAVAAVVAVLVVAAAVAVHTVTALGMVTIASPADVNFLDIAAGAVLALLFGTAYGIRIGGNGAVSAANAALSVAQAAHARLDAVGAPPAAELAAPSDGSTAPVIGAG